MSKSMIDELVDLFEEMDNDRIKKVSANRTVIAELFNNYKSDVVCLGKISIPNVVPVYEDNSLPVGGIRIEWESGRVDQNL
jgi:hypothetical protein